MVGGALTSSGPIASRVIGVKSFTKSYGRFLNSSGLMAFTDAVSISV